MIIGNDFVFIHNPITGGVFVRSIMEKSHPNSEFLNLTSWHLPVKKLANEHRNKFKFGTIRNPWVWYFSFYKKCQTYGGPYARLIDPDRKLPFKQWIMKLLSTEMAEKLKDDATHMIGDPWSEHNIYHFKYMLNKDIGLYTYQYIYLFFNQWEEIFSGKAPMDHSLISIDEVIKLEGIVDNMIESFNRHKLHLSDKQKKQWRNGVRVNITPKGVNDIFRYYDDELKDIIEYKDRFIIKNNNYNFKFV